MKKSDLIRIIKEEIDVALGEGPMEDKAAKEAKKRSIEAQIKALQSQLAALAQGGSMNESEELNEMPIYNVNDKEGFKSTLDTFREKGVSKSKALNVLLKKLEDEGMVDTNALSKSYGVDTATFNNKEIRKFLNRPKDEAFIDKSGEELIDFTPFLDKSDKKRSKTAGSSSVAKPEMKKEEPKKATLTKGDDGFDDVSYSKEEEKEKPKVASNALADKKDDLLADLKDNEAKRRELAKVYKKAEGAEKEEALKGLKDLTAKKEEIEKKLSKLGF